ncbi:MAG: nitroreductase family protein [Candidatus Hodarchaeales archaeon]
MDAIEALLTRRSIRKFREGTVTEDNVKEILKSAMHAPSAGNQQPWQFVVINDRKILERIPSVHPYSKMVRQASLAILVCGDKRLEKHEGYWIQDCSAATQNLLLAVHALGLGGVWLGIYPRKDRVSGMKKLLNLPDEVTPLSLIPIGIPGEEKQDVNRYLKERIHYNNW